MRKLVLFIAFLSAFTGSYAQKLPQVQQVSLRAPANARADGKPTEWLKMQAYNPTGEVYYTIANDDKKLYLVFQSKDDDMLTKLVNGGISFMIQHSGKKSDVGAVGAKFPYMPDINQRVSFGWNSDNGEADHRYITAISKSMADRIKWIYTKGLLAKDGPIPVYNDEGIQAGAKLDNKGVYTCELAFDLSLLGLSTGNLAKFAYHIIINGEPNKLSIPPQKGGGVVKRDGSPVSESEKAEALAIMANKLAALSSTPDFWGEYTLAK